MIDFFAQGEHRTAHWRTQKIVFVQRSQCREAFAVFFARQVRKERNHRFATQKLSFYFSRAGTNPSMNAPGIRTLGSPSAPIVSSPKGKDGKRRPKITDLRALALYDYKPKPSDTVKLHLVKGQVVNVLMYGEGCVDFVSRRFLSLR